MNLKFSNFWCNVSLIKFGPNVKDETAIAIREALERFVLPAKKPKKAQVMT